MRVGIVNDLPLAVASLRRALMLDASLEVAWVAEDGAQAVALCARDKPDVVLMDLMMPVMDGVEATRRIMAESPCAIVIVTVDVGRHTARVFEAMGHGAVDAVDTPALGGADPQQAAAPLLRKIRNVAWLIGERVAPRADCIRVPTPSSGSRALIAVGASAGGPPALAQLLAALPADFPVPIVLVQHVDVMFAEGMAKWLNDQVPLNVRIAREGETPRAGSALLAGTNDHLRLSASGALTYSAAPREMLYRPSIDVFFESVATHWRGDAVGVLLTGMGRDGALGLKALRDRGMLTIAQDKDSCAVYGMPKAAAEMGAAVEIKPLVSIGPRLCALYPSPSQRY